MLLVSNKTEAGWYGGVNALLCMLSNIRRIACFS